MLPRALFAPIRTIRVSIPSPSLLSWVPSVPNAAAACRGVRALPFASRAEFKTTNAARSL